MAQQPPQPLNGASRYLRPQDLRRFQNFQFAARIVVEGFHAGRHRSPYHDASAEFSDYRPYVPGDEIRSLDWRAYARTDRDYVKLFRKETDMRCHVLLDASRSMIFKDEGERSARAKRRAGAAAKVETTWREERKSAPVSKFEYGAYLAAALCYLMVQQGDKASLALGAADLINYVPPGGRMTHLRSLMVALEQAKPAGQTDMARSLRSLFALARRRGLLVVISDFLEPPGPLFDSLAMFGHRGWQILLLQVLSQTELELPGIGVTRYFDPETGAAMDAEPDELREAYLAEMEAFFETLERNSKARRIHYARMSTHDPYTSALEQYLTTRSQS